MNELPAEVKHHIMYLLDWRNAARTSVLSKSWKTAWYSRRVIVLKNYNMSDDEFADFLERSLQRHLDSGLSVAALRLRMSSCRRPQTSDAICHFAVATNLKELKISVLSLYSPSGLNLLSSNTLTKLHLTGIELKHGHLEFPCLRTIKLKFMTMDSTVLQDLVSACPSLEVLTVFGMNGLTTLDFPRLDMLKKFDVTLHTQVSKIALKSPNLESFSCCWLNCNEAPEIKLEACETSLKELSITGIDCTNEWLQSQVYKFCSLKVLILKNLFGPTTLKISSTQLTDLRVISCTFLDVNTEIYAPNLLHLEFRDNQFPFYSLVTSSSSLKSVAFEFCLGQEFDDETIWFNKLSELFVNINDMSNVVVSIIFRNHKTAIVHEGLGDALLDILFDLHNSAMLVKVFITRDYKSWENMLLNPYVADTIFVASSYDNDDTLCLSELLLKHLPDCDVDLYDSPYTFGWQYVQSYTMEVLEDWSEFEGDVETKHALLRAYSESPSAFIRFDLCWFGES